MQTQFTPASRQGGYSDPLKQHACIQVIIRFCDGNARTFYSRDVDHRNNRKYHNHAFWIAYWRGRIEKETPAGWQGRVVEGAIFYSFDGNRGDKIAQWSKFKGGWQ